MSKGATEAEENLECLRHEVRSELLKYRMIGRWS